MILLLAACITNAPGSVAPDPLDGDDPRITEVSWACVVEDSAWYFTVSADAWTGGGRIFLARDAGRYEEHRIRSTSAAADGSADTLELSLAIVADWRDASSGTSTGWRCDDEGALSFQATVFETTGESLTDCRTWGAQPDLWSSIEPVADCDTELTISDTGLGTR